MITKAEIHTEAMRDAKYVIKRMIVADGGKLSHFGYSTIAKAAKELIAADPRYLRNAKRRLAQRRRAPKRLVMVKD